MNVILNANEIEFDNIQFLDKKNNIIMDGNFTKLIYSDSHLTVSGLYVYFPIHIKSIFKNTAFFDIHENSHILNEITDIENIILQHYTGIHKSHPPLTTVSVKKQLALGMIKLNSFTPPQFQDMNHFNLFSCQYDCVIKISGVWENKNTIGMTYKFLQCKPPLF